MPATIHLELWYTYLRQRGREEKSETDTEGREAQDASRDRRGERQRDDKMETVGIKERIQGEKEKGR